MTIKELYHRAKDHAHRAKDHAKAYMSGILQREYVVLALDESQPFVQQVVLVRTPSRQEAKKVFLDTIIAGDGQAEVVLRTITSIGSRTYTRHKHG